ncbi:unnamed protein product [Heterobilharzia americana]|nr:unnamed protein product [Heterobilharzia americana]
MSFCLRALSADVLVEKLKVKIARVYYNHGLFISTHPAPVITIVCILMIFLCYPLTQIPIVKEVPIHSAVVRDDEFQSFKDSRYVFTHDDQNKSLGYMLQIVVHSTILTKIPECYVNHETITHLLQQSNKLVELVRQFRSTGDDGKSDGQTFDDICFQVEDRAVSEVESSETIKDVLPTFGCLLLAPSFLLDGHLGVVQSPQPSVMSRIRLAAVGNLRDLLFGFPWKTTGLSKYSVCSRKHTVTYALTLVFREYKPSFFSELRDYLISHMENFHGNVDITKETRKSSDKSNTASVGHIFLVWYSDRSYFADYAPLIFIYVILLLYVYFSVRKLEMVKSKWGLALSACVTVAASLFMSIGLCVTIGLVMPTLNGSEVFPYLVVLIGFENVIVLTKSVVATPLDLPVKYRIAEGLSKESWSLTKLYLTGLLLLGLGFFTFHPTMQEFCLFAVVGLTTDFFLQLFFFVTILSVDIRRMELSDLMLEYPVNSLIQEPQMLPPFYSTTPSSSSSSSLDMLMSNKCITESSNSSQDKMSEEDDVKAWRKPLSYLLSLISNMCFMSFKSTKKVLLRSRITFVKRHKRTVSAAQTAAYLASDGRTSQNVPRRLRVLRCWAKSRLIQRVLMLIFTVWIIGFLIHTVDIFQLFFNIFLHFRILLLQYTSLNNWLNLPLENSDNSSHDSDLDISLVSEHSVLNSDAFITPHVNSSESPLFLVNYSTHHELQETLLNISNANVSMTYIDAEDSDFDDYDNFSNRQEMNHHDDIIQEHYISSLPDADIKSQVNMANIPHRLQVSTGTKEQFTWDTVLIWNYLAYYHWPLLAKHYNLSLVGCHLALLEPVHLKYRFSMTKLDSGSGKSMNSDQESVSYIPVEHERTLDMNNLRFLDDNILLSNEKTSHLRASSTSPGGFTGWTARLGLTASMLGTSLLGCSLVLLLTCLGMVCLQSKSSNSTKREPIIRVLPLTIELLNLPTDLIDSEFDQSCLSSPEWTIACGQVYHKNKDSLYSRGVLAVTSVRSYIRVKSDRSKVIQLWCANSGNLLNDLERYSEAARARRRKIPPCIPCRKFSTVWCMEFLPQGLLVVGCSDGTIEIWDCVSGLLMNILCLNEVNDTRSLFTKENKENSDTVPQSKVHPGGITVMRIIDETRFCVGTSHGVVAYFHLHNTNKNSSQNSLPFCSSEHDTPLFHCGVDTTPVLSMALNRFAIGISHASGSLYVCCLEILLNRTSKSVNFEGKHLVKPLEIRLVELTFLTNGYGVTSTIQETSASASVQNKKLSTHTRPGSINLQLFTRIEGYSGKTRKNCNKLSALANYRLVTYDMDGTVVIWDLQQKCMIRSFKANLSTFNMLNLLLSVGGRVVFGDQSYLRVVNPWTAKYERSVQLLPPSSVNMRSSHNSNSSHLSTLLRRWTKELVPLGVTGGDFKSSKASELYLIANGSTEHVNLTPINLKTPIRTGGLYVISIADGGRTLVVVPVSTIKFD